MWSMTTLNVVLAGFSILMAIVALGLLAFVVARDRYVPREPGKIHGIRDRIKRHESVVVDFRDPSTIPDHFLQLNTLMFKKRDRANNNQIKEVEGNDVIPLPGMDGMMAPISEEDELSHRSPSSGHSSVDRKRTGKAQSTSSSEGFYSTSTRTSMASDSEIDYSESIAEETPKPLSNNAISRAKRIAPEPPETEKNQTEEVTTPTIEPAAQRIILSLECGNEYSLC